MWDRWIKPLYTWAFLGNRTLLIVFGVAALTLACGGMLAYRVQSDGVFLALLAIAVGGSFLAFAALGISVAESAPYFALLSIAVGGYYLLFFACCKGAKRVRAKRKEKERWNREVQFTLPQRDNTLVRDRLHSALREEEPPSEGEELQFRFAYATALLAKLRAQPLSVAERLETNELGKVLALYKEKERYLGEDIRLLGETFSRVLKLAAKYGV